MERFMRRRKFITYLMATTTTQVAVAEEPMKTYAAAWTRLNWKQMGHLADQKFKGAKPGDIPIQQVTTHRWAYRRIKSISD